MEQLNLNWHTYSDHLKEIMNNLMNSHKSADVTLVCHDKTKFKAHKFVLSACSPVFQSIIDDLPNRGDSFIYLRGVESQEMKSILQFMYLGQATFYQDRMNEFLNVAKSLEVKEISKDVECDNVDRFRDQENYENNHQDNEICTKDSYIQEEIGQTVTKVKDYNNEAGPYQCGKCEKTFTHPRRLYRHKKSVHEGLRFPSNECNQTFKRRDNLKVHLESIHEGIKFSCDLCVYVTNQKSNLITHKKNKHKPHLFC